MTPTPISVSERRLAIARTLYQALVAQDPNRAITLCDSSPLTDDLVHLAHYWRSFLPSRRRCHRRRPGFLARLMRPAPNDNQRGCG
jgi:hypothetical protein